MRRSGPDGVRLFWWLWMAGAMASPQPLVVLGDGLVASASVPSGPGPAAGSWASVLADCLEEQAPGRWTVMDRTAEAETARTALARVTELGGLQAGLVVIAVGAREVARADATPTTFRADLAGLLAAVEGAGVPRVLLVGVVPPGGPATSSELAALDAKIKVWNEVIATAASPANRRYVDVWTDWPGPTPERGRLADDNARLTHQGHARVAAAVCDATVSLR